MCPNPLVHSLADKEDFAGVVEFTAGGGDPQESGGGAKIVCYYLTIGVPDV